MRGGDLVNAHPVSGTHRGSERRPDMAPPPGRQLDRRELMAAVRRRWWIVALTGAVVVLATVGFLARRPDEYTARTLLRKHVDEPVLGGASLLGLSRPAEGVEADVQIIRSRAVLGPVVDRLGLRIQLTGGQAPRRRVLAGVSVEPGAGRGEYRLEPRPGGQVALVNASSGGQLDAGTPGAWLDGPGFKVMPGDSVGDGAGFQVLFRDEAVDLLEDRLVADAIGGTSLIRIAYTAPDPVHAAEIVGAVAAAFQEQAAAAGRERAGRKRSFLEAQLAQVADSLEAAEEQERTYQERSGTLDPHLEGATYVASIMDAEKQIRELRSQTAVLTALLRALDSPASSDEALLRAVALGRDFVPGATATFERLQELEVERGRLTASRYGYTTAAPGVDALDSLITQAKLQIRDLSQQALTVADQRRAEAQARLDDLSRQARRFPDRSTDFLRLQDRTAAIKDRYDLIANKYYEALIGELTEGGDIEVVDPVAIPAAPDPVHPLRRLLLALVVALTAGVGVALAVELVDQAIRSPGDLKGAAGLEVLGAIPRATGPLKAGPGAGPLVFRDPDGVQTEAFRTLRTMLRVAPAQPARVLAVMSAAPGDGKSTVAVNLALAIAREGSRVLLVDADLARPVQHLALDVEAGPGVVDVLSGSCSLTDAVRPTASRTLDILAAGSTAAPLSDIVAPDRLRLLLQHAAQEYDVVVVDTPPVLATSDAIMISTVVEGVLMVARVNATDRRSLTAAIQQLRLADAPLLGVVLNDLPSQLWYGHHYLHYARNGSRRHDPSSRRLERMKALLGRGD